jgi:tetratricopeptide (TPR) repeat protein
MSLEAYSKKRFLIVDELDNFRFSTKKTLMSLGLKLVDGSSSAQKVVAGFQNIDYDVVLCNYELGKGKNGQELLEELRYKKLLKFTGLFFIISAEVEKGKVMGTIENEPDGYLVKPVTPSNLQSRLLKSLEMKDAMRDIDVAIDEGDYHSAIAYCDRKIAAKDRYTARCMKTKAWLLGKVGELDKAREVYESVLNSGDFLWAQYGLAKTLIKQRQYTKAEALLSEIISQDEKQVEAMDLLAQIYKKQSKPEDAQDMIEKAISVSPNCLLRQQDLAQLCIQNNKQEAATNAFRKMVKLGDQSIFAKPDQYYEFADYLAGSVKDSDDAAASAQAKEAFDLLNKSKKRFSMTSNIEEKAKLMSASVNATLGNMEEAEAIFDAVMHDNEGKLPELDPNTFQIAAQALQSMGKPEQAERLLEEAADIAKGDEELVSEIYDQLNSSISSANRQKAIQVNKKGIKLYNEGKTEQAATELRQAIPLTPRHISLNLNLTQVLLRQHKESKDDSLLKDISGYLHKVRHIPQGHKEYKRFVYLEGQYNDRK